MVASPEEGGRWVLRRRGERRRPVAPVGSAASLSPAAWVRGAARLPPRHLARGVPFREMLLRPWPPLPASRAAAPPGTPQTRSPRRAKSLEISTAARDRYPAPGSAASPARTLAPRPAPRRKELALISEFSSAPQPSAAPRTSQTNARGLVEIKVPSLPHSPNCRLRPAQIRDARLERAPRSRPCSLETEANN